MSFAAPWFLAGLAALAVPILVHLVEREERAGTPFPSLMFLRRIPFKARRRRTLRDPLLLALRCLGLALLAFAFAGPHLTGGEDLPAADRDPVHRVVLLDRSYSMGYGGRWERAVAAARERLASLPDGGRAALVLFDDATHVARDLTADREGLAAELERARPGPGSTRYAGALAAAERLLEGSDAARREVVVVTDLQRTGFAGGRGARLGAGLHLDVVPVAADRGRNAAVMDARLVERGEAADERSRRTLAVRIRNTGDEELIGLPVRVEVDGRMVEARSVDLPPGTEATVETEVVVASDRPSRARVRIGPDGLAADDDFHLVLAPEGRLAVPLMGPGDRREGSGFFLEQALGLARSPRIETTRRPVAALGAGALAGADAVVLDDVPLPRGPAGDALARYVAKGGGLLVVAAAGTGEHWPGGADGFLPGRLGPAVERTGRSARIGEMDVDHPLLAPFRAPGAGDLSGARVSRYRRLEPGPGDQVLARYDDGAAAVVERAGDGGRVLVVTTTLDPRWSGLAAEPEFAPLMIEAIRYLAGRPRANAAVPVGEPVDLARHAAALPGGGPLARHLAAGGQALVEAPGGTVRRLDPGQSLLVPGAPGIHEVHGGQGAGPPVPLAANAHRRESDLAVLDLDAFTGSIRRPAADPEAAAREKAAVRLPPPDERTLWWYLLAAAAAALAAEAVLANFLARRRVVRESVPEVTRNAR